MLRWVSIAPFGTPVVPPVYCRKASSSDSISGSSVACAPPSLSARRNAHGLRQAPGGNRVADMAQDEIDDEPRGPPRRSPTPVTTTVRNAVPSIAF